MNSKIAKFMTRHRKAADSKNPFPPDRIFPATNDIMMFGDELRDFCEGYIEIVEELENAKRQLRSMNV